MSDDRWVRFASGRSRLPAGWSHPRAMHLTRHSFSFRSPYRNRRASHIAGLRGALQTAPSAIPCRTQRPTRPGTPS